MDEKKIPHIVTGDILLTNVESAKNSTKVPDLKAIGELFMKRQMKEPEERISPERDRGIKDIFSSNLGNLDSVDIKDHNWEQVRPPTRSTDVEAMDTKALRPSRAEREGDVGGTDVLASNLNSIFDPNRIEKAQNSEFTDHIIDSARDRRREAEEKRQGSREWETEEKSKTTADIPVSQMGFTPLRTAFEPAPLPKVDIPEVRAEVERSRQSAEAGIKAADLKRELDKAMNEKWNREFNDNRGWEEKTSENIADRFNRPMEVEAEKIKVAEEFTPMSPKKPSIDLSGLFPVLDVKLDSNIKRESDGLKSDRTKRQDDRSWETLDNSKSKKF